MEITVSQGAAPPSPERIYLVYADNGMKLVYAGDDRSACEQVCSSLARTAAGHVSGFQFVGRQRYELRAYFDAAPPDSFLATRLKGELFDFAWHPHHPA